MASVPTGPLILGFVQAAGAPLGSPEQVAAFASYLGDKLGAPVRVEPFADKVELYQALYRYRKIDLAVFQGAIPERPNHLPLSNVATWQGQGTSGESGQLAARRGLFAETLARVRHTLLTMVQDNQGRSVLAKAGSLKFVSAGSPAPDDGPSLKETAGLKP